MLVKALASLKTYTNMPLFMFYRYGNSSVLEAHATDALAKGLNIMIIALP